MLKECQNRIRRNPYFGKALVIVVLVVFVGIAMKSAYFAEAQEVRGATGDTRMQSMSAVRQTEMHFTAETKTKVTQMTNEIPEMTDLTDAFAVILQGVSRDFIAGYEVDESFLMWLAGIYGDEAVIQLAYTVLDQNMYVDRWYEITGASIHVLWLEYCKEMGFQSYLWENVYPITAVSDTETVISFTGDINFADDWYTMEYLSKQPNGIYDCISSDLIELMNASDIMMINNEFVYSDRGIALDGKAYTFRAATEHISLLDVLGTDIVNLANNHVYDYGQIGLIDTLNQLEKQKIAYVGAGNDLSEASKAVYYIANGKKVGIVSASEIERSIQYTKEATDDSCGVLKMLYPEKFLEVIRQTKQACDYVIAVTHWGTEGNLLPDVAQKRYANMVAEAGADVIIGGHPHRLQGVSFIGNVPVAYSLGNFWFSTGTLYTTVAQVMINADGSIALKFVPCLQKNLTTSLIKDTNNKGDFYNYLASISTDVGIDDEGIIYNKSAENYSAVGIRYDSDTCRIDMTGGYDNEGNAIDIVGNLE